MGIDHFSNRFRLRAARVSAPPDGASPGALLAQLRDECEAMARYALHHGLPVAPETIALLSALIDCTAPENPPPGTAGDAPRYAATSQHSLASIHRKLAALIAPATPQAVTLLDAQHRLGRPFAWLGPVPLIRLLTVASIAFLIAVVATGLSPDVSADNVERGFLDSHGTQLLWNALFLLFCAGLGASFATLFQAHRYIAASTYDPKYDASYGARLILGLIAGLILVEMLPSRLFDQGSMHSFGKPALSMLGGFSATAVHRLLQRLVDTLDTLVRGDRSSDADAAQQTRRAQAVSERTQWQSEIAASLLELQQSLDHPDAGDTVRQRLADLTRAMLAGEPARLSVTPIPNDPE